MVAMEPGARLSLHAREANAGALRVDCAAVCRHRGQVGPPASDEFLSKVGAVGSSLEWAQQPHALASIMTILDVS